ncbi:MAG: S8 family serine peptidase [Streptosporangiales bacterium]|nr:S8 family serine peptidase [Streptosporangiales bacterium]MBO0889984.1 S8 family serine peptidase [Acidothermales bacterium]
MVTSGPSWGPLPPPPAGPPAAPVGGGEQRNGTAVAVLLALLGGWAVALAVLGQFLAFGADQVDPTKQHTAPWLLATLLLGVLVCVPSTVLWQVSTHPRARAVARAWAVVAGLVAVVSPVRLLPTQWSMLVMVILAVAAAAVAVTLSRLPAFAVPRTRGEGGTLVAAAAGLLTLLPWAFYGALGGVFETLLALALAGAGGWLVAVVLAPVWREIAGSWRRSSAVLVGGLVAGVTCCVLFAGLSPRVSGLWLAVCVPPLGFVCAAASRDAPRRLPTLAGVGVAAFGPLAFIDPDEVNAILGLQDAIRYAFIAMGLAVVAGLVGSGGLAGLANALRSRAVAAAVACVALVGAGVLYAVGGQPGFDGDRLFVVLKQQAPVASLAGTRDLTARRTAVYHRLVDFADRTQRPLRGALGDIGVGYTPYYLDNALEVDAGPQLRPWLESRGDVAEVLDSPRLRPIRTLPPVDHGTSPAPRQPDWNLTMIRADDVWNRLHDRGSGVVVGQSDSGVDGTHPALAASYRGRGGHDDDNWLDPWYGSRSPTDWGGHGTHTLGTAVGADDVGVAPDAKWIGCVNLGRNLGDPALYLTCMQFMLAPYPQHGDPLRDGDPSRAADVLNNSWGCPDAEGCDANAMRPAVDALTAAGIFVVASAGNDGPGCGTIRDPISLYADSFSVGAVDATGNVAPFSSRGPVTADGSHRQKPDIAAPGVGVLSALPGGGYGRLDGTSMAGPHVTGTVALMWSANPALKGDVTRTAQILRSTAQGAALSKSGSNCGSDENVVGAGIVDAYSAVVAAKKATS